MAAGKIGARLSYFLTKVFLGKLYWILLAAMLTVGLAELAGLKWPRLHDWVNLAVAIFCGAVVIVFILPNFFNSVFGREFFLGATRCEVAANSAPDGTSAKIVT